MSSERMLSFESLFHAGFRMSAARLVKGLAVRGELADFARRALLTKLLFEHLEGELPDVSEADVQEYFDQMRHELDYHYSEERTERWLKDLEISLEEGALWIERHLRVEKYLLAFTARHIAMGGDSLVEQLFVTKDLRAAVVAVASVEVAAAKRESSPTPEDLADARTHLECRHRGAAWGVVEAKLMACGLSAAEIDSEVRTYACAAWTVRS
jgi:hypothetical protein